MSVATPARAFPAAGTRQEGQPPGRARFAPRSVPERWPATELGPAEVVERMTSAPFCADHPDLHRRQATGVELLINWLCEQPGESWQERWLGVESNILGQAWGKVRGGWLAARPRRCSWHSDLMAVALRLAISADIVRPSPRWLVSGASGRGALVRVLATSRDPAGFGRMAQYCQTNPEISPAAQTHAAYRAALILAAKGGTVAEITVGDVVELLDTETEVWSKASSGSGVFYRVLLATGALEEHAPPSLRHLRTAGPRSPEQLIDRYHLACRPVRDLLVSYLKERQPALDYNSLDSLANLLGLRFWADLEAHNPGIDSLRLAPDVVYAWKQRLRRVSRRTRTPDGSKPTVAVDAPRLSYRECLTPVRALYLDLAHWAVEDPGRWAAWVAPCPIGEDEGVTRKATRQRKARMDARTRQQLPVLPSLVAALKRRRKEAADLLELARRTKPGETLTAEESTLLRLPRRDGVWVDDPEGRPRNLALEEQRAFWAWAIVEVLRHTGIRIEELLELSHHNIVKYRLPKTGETIPLLQIVPSKTDAERLLVVSPELAEVLSAVIRRNQDLTGVLPLVSRYDDYERVWLAPAPLLLQRRINGEQHAFAHSSAQQILTAAVARTGLVDPVEGRPLHYSPHDFRRMFITDAIMNGLPPHIAQVIAGHHDISVTLGYKAVYPEETIQAHLAFLSRRRELRPSEEYRVPSDEEWEEFLGQFERRKVSLGTCARAFGTACIHEHACIRCSMLWPDPAQRPRLNDIRQNLIARIDEARREGWTGEVEGLSISLAGAQNKLHQIERKSGSNHPVVLG